MFATIVSMNGVKWRSAWFNDRAEAIEYAKRMVGVQSVEEIGVGVIWEREG